MIALLFALLLLLPIAAQAQTWPQGLHDAVNSGESEVSFPATTPVVYWTITGQSTATNCGDGIANRHPDSGAATNSTHLYTSADKKPGAGNARSEFYKLDILTGAQVWVYDPCIDEAKHDGLVTLDPGHNIVIYPAHDGMLRALDMTTGALVWAFYVADAYPSAGPTEGGATLSGGLLYYLAQLEMLALDPGTLVTNATDCPLTPTSCPTVTWRVARFVSGSAHGVASKPAVSGGVVYWGGYQEFTASNATTGAQVWHRSTSAWPGTSNTLTGWTYGFSIIHFHSGVVYACAADASGSISQTLCTAYTPSDGTVIWETIPTVDFVVKPVISAEQGLLIGGYDMNLTDVGGIIAFNLSDGSVAWQHPWGKIANAGASVGGTGGVWGATGTYCHTVVATVSCTNCNRASQETTSVITATTQKATITWDVYTSPVGGTVTGYKVYRTATCGSYPGNVDHLVATIGSPSTTTFVDDGSAASNGSPIALTFTNAAGALTANSRIIVSESIGMIHMLNAATGAEVWSYGGTASMHGATSIFSLSGTPAFATPSNDTQRIFLVPSGATRTGPSTQTGPFTLTFQ